MYWVVYWLNSSGEWETIYSGTSAAQAQTLAGSYFNQGDRVFAWIWDGARWQSKTDW